MGRCKSCNSSSLTISSVLGYCVDCIREGFSEVKKDLGELHRESRRRFGLVEQIPKGEGKECNYCGNRCIISEGQRGFCTVRRLEGEFLRGGGEGYLSYYYDPLPTNCVADWVCPGGTGSGFPEFCYKNGPETGYRNLAVFYHACTFNCLYCQNWHFRRMDVKGKGITAEALAAAVDERTSCICYFGGDPSSQIIHSIKSARIARRIRKGRILRICWETNGSMKRDFLREILEIAIESGGCVKFDLKAWDRNLHHALCGTDNNQTLENFHFAASFIKHRRVPPLVVASTLLVPGYVDEKEIRSIARFISSLDPEIPFSLLGFYPDFYLTDLPTTSRSHAERCIEVAKEEGLKRVKIGNVHLLSDAY